ncbi:hypothetical protein, partial [Listeria monocytogenes]
AFSFISAGYITLVLIETPPLVSFYMNPTKVFLSYSHFLVAVPRLMSGFYFLSFLLFMIVTIKTAKAIISVRLSKTVTRLSFPGNA